MTSDISSRSRDDGFTLVEILIAMLALGIILPAVVGTFVVGLNITDETNRRLIDSNDVQSAAAFVSGDVQNTTEISTSDTSTCIAAAYPATRQALLLRWTDRADEGNPVAHVVNYYVSDGQLIRSACVGGGGSVAQVLVHDLDPGTNPDVVCQQPSTCTSATTPVSIALRGKTISGQFFSLIGTRRTT